MSGTVFWSIAVWLIIIQQSCSAQSDGDKCDIMPPCPAMPPRGSDADRQYDRLYYAAKKGNLTGVTESQVKEFCQQHVGSLTCDAKHLQTCLPPVPRLALLGFLEDTIALGAFCQRPDLYEKTKVLATCLQTVDSIYREDFYWSRNRSVSEADHRRYFSEGYTCLAVGSNFGNRPDDALSPFLINAVWQSRHDYKRATNQTAVQKDVCCVLKKLSTCLPALAIVREKCTTEFRDLAKNIFAAALQHYSCTDELGCPSTTRTI